MIKLGGNDWSKSTYCANATCVEVRSTEPAALEVTDSKFAKGALSVRLSPAAFTALVDFAAADARV